MKTAILIVNSIPENKRPICVFRSQTWKPLMRSCLFLLTIFFLAVFISTTHAVTVYVPDDFLTIQAAIDACVDGDSVIVRDGTYTGDGNRDIDFTGKAIVLMSENGLEVTIIDCEGDSLNPHRGFYFHSGEDSTSVLQGFTITNGYKSNGGGMHNGGGSPLVINCTFNENEADSGGGMFNGSSNPTVTNCTFSGNRAKRGAGMLNRDSSPTVTNCTFSQNDAYRYGGAGMWNFYYSSPTVTNCMFTGNSANFNGGGMRNRESSNPTVTNCMFIGNSAGDCGGGMYNGSSNPTVTNCMFIGNSAANYGGGGMGNRESSNPTVTNCTFSGNSATYYHGGMYNSYSDPTVTNCILWGDLPNEIGNSYSNPTVTYSNVQGGYPGEGNIDEDPLFVSFHGFDYLLRKGSPCIDAGDPAIEDGRNWPIWYNNGLRSDMGAYGGPGNVGWLQ